MSLWSMAPITPNPYDVCALLDEKALRALEMAPTDVFMYVISRGVLSMTEVVGVLLSTGVRIDSAD